MASDIKTFLTVFLFACIRHYFPRQGGSLNCAGAHHGNLTPPRNSRSRSTGVSLWTDGIMAGQLANAALAGVGIALHLIWPSFDAEMLRTGGLRALGLTLAPSANVFKLPDMTAWSGVCQGTGGN